MNLFKRLFGTEKEKKYLEALKSKTIYFGEESLAEQAVARQTLHNVAEHVVCFADGQALQNRINEVAPDVVLADIHLHGINGYDIARTIQQHDSRPAIPVILLIDRSDNIDQHRFIQSGAVDYLKKPLKSEKLLSCLKKVVS